MYEFFYDGTIEGLLCVIIRCINMRIMPSAINVRHNHFDSGEYIKSDYVLADKMYRYIGAQSSVEIQQMIMDCFLTCLPDKEKAIYLMIYKALKFGAVIAERYDDELMRRIQLAIRDLYREGQYQLSNISMSRQDDVSVGIINPRNCVLPIIKEGIRSRLSTDKCLILDKRHNLAFVYSGRRNEMVDVSMMDISGREGLCSSYLYSAMWPYFEEHYFSCGEGQSKSALGRITGMKNSYITAPDNADSLVRLWYRAV